MFYDPFRSTSRSTTKRAQQIREAVAARLGRFGKPVVEMVAELALTPNKLENILERWNLSTHNDLQSQLDALAYYIAQSGPEEFLARLKSELAAAMRDTLQVNKPDVKPGSATEASRISTGHYARSVKLPESQSKPPVDEPPPLEVVLNLPSDSHAPALEELYPDVPPESVEVRELEWIESTTYSGPDRRSGPADRRSHRERRSQVGAVMKNRRFGPNRRVRPKGRRKNDHE